jgi:hypothetical protein
LFEEKNEYSDAENKVRGKSFPRTSDFETARVCDQAAWLEAPGRIARSQPSAREAVRVYNKKTPVTADRV